MTLVHVPGTLPDINVTLRLLQNNIINVKWTWAKVNGSYPAGVKVPFEVPDEFITTENYPESQFANLSQFVIINNAPFSISFRYRG